MQTRHYAGCPVHAPGQEGALDTATSHPWGGPGPQATQLDRPISTSSASACSSPGYLLEGRDATAEVSVSPPGLDEAGGRVGLPIGERAALP